MLPLCRLLCRRSSSFGAGLAGRALPWRNASHALASSSSRSSLAATKALAANAPDAAKSQPTQRTASPRARLEALVEAALLSAFPDRELWKRAVVAPTADPRFGDYQCNNAMPLFARVKGAEGAPANPRATADAIVAALPPNDVVSNVSIAGPGFINFELSDAYLAEQVGTLVGRRSLEAGEPVGPGADADADAGDAFLASRLASAAVGMAAWAPPAPCGRAVVDFSSPNVAKEMHVGHLRSTILGDCLCRVLEFAGTHVIRLNHVGDWGTQFGMLIQHMDEAAMPSDQSVGDLQVLYREAKGRFDSEDDFKRRAQEAVVKLQGGSEPHRKRWETICDASRKEVRPSRPRTHPPSKPKPTHTRTPPNKVTDTDTLCSVCLQFDAIYSRLGVTLEERGESFYNDALAPLVGELLASGIAERSDGAVCIFVDGIKVPLIIQKSDGGFGYATTDLAAIKQRVKEEQADWIIYITDSGQAQHFKGIFAAARKCGWVAPAGKEAGGGKGGKGGEGGEGGEGGGPRVDHVGFGLVMGEDGRRLRTRSGDAVRLADLLDEAVARCEAQIRERQPSASDGEVRRAAECMGYGAVKYADLKQNKATDYEFSYDRMLDLKGNTAVYLQYAHARICSILRKAGGGVGKGKGEGEGAYGLIAVTDPAERALLLALCQFPEAVQDTLEDLAPNRLCEYLYGLTGKFTDFYGACQVLGSEEEQSRVQICVATLWVIRKCFELLGMVPLNRI